MAAVKRKKHVIIIEWREIQRDRGPFSLQNMEGESERKDEMKGLEGWFYLGMVER